MRAQDEHETGLGVSSATRRFAADEDGSMAVFGLFVASIIFVTLGLAVDAMDAEYRRTKLQTTVDSAVLAAADLDQRFDAAEVVRSYFAAAGLLDALDPVPEPVETLNSRTVSASAREDMATSFLSMVGIDTLDIVAAGTANETVPEVEISLVVDVSGSMAFDGRLPRLRSAAREFVGTVIDPDADAQLVSVSIVPFATQVNAGPRLLDALPTADDHGYSHCVDFDRGAFDEADIDRPQGDPMRRTGHFELSTYSRGPAEIDYVCHPAASREIMPWSHDVATLQAYIDALEVGGNTSIDIGAKWGTALLDPSMRGIVDDQVDDGLVHAHFRGRPAPHEAEQALKVMVVMSDGENTPQYVLRDRHRPAPSSIWVDEAPGEPAGDHADDNYSTHYRYDGVDYWYQHSAVGMEEDEEGNSSYNSADRGWRLEPHGGLSGAREMAWPELFDRVSVAWWSRYLRAPLYGGGNLAAYSNAFSTIDGAAKDARTRAICGTARRAGIVVYTISFEAPVAGQRILRECASSEAHYFDVDGIEITEAFRAIANQINQLRLTR